MARKKTNTKKSVRYSKTTKVPHRGTYKARPSLRDLIEPSPTFQKKVQRRLKLQEIEDHRSEVIVPRLTDGRRAKVRPNNIDSPSPMKFTDPKRTIECKRRRDRRRAIFAKKLQGKGSGSKRRRLPKYKGIKC